MSYHRQKPDPDWFAFVRKGDVLLIGGSYRVVREVSRWERVRRGVVREGVGPLRFVTFAIRRRSWTNRAYTVYTATDLKVFGAQYVGVRIPLTGEMDQRIAHCIHAKELPGSYSLTADDVRGVA